MTTIEQVCQHALAASRLSSVYIKNLFMCCITGSMTLEDVVKLFDDETMQQLKNECGGMQTLLRNNHQLFHGKSVIQPQRKSKVPTCDHQTLLIFLWEWGEAGCLVI